MKNGSIARAAAVVIATMRETNILQALAVSPEELRDCSAVLAYLFSTAGCIAIVAALAAADLRITGSRRVIRDVVVPAAPILYVTGVKWPIEHPRPITSVGSACCRAIRAFPADILQPR